MGFLVFTSVLVAQGNRKDSSLEKMQFLIADWKVSHFENKEGKWHLVGDTQSSIKAILEGSFLSEKVKYLIGANELNMLVHIGYGQENRWSKTKCNRRGVWAHGYLYWRISTR